MGKHSTCEIKLAAMSALWGGNPPKEKLATWLEEVKSAGYDGVGAFDDEGWIADAASIAKDLGEYELELASYDLWLPTDMDHCRKVCDFLAELGCCHLVTLGWSGKTDSDFAALAEHLNEIGGIALERGIRAVYHNHTGSTGETFEDMDRLLSLVDPKRFFVMVDTGHATMDFINQPVAERAVLFLRKYWDRLDFIEFKDWHPETGLNTPVGEGLCDYGAVFALLKEKGYSGWITVEQNGTSRGRTPLACARISREFIYRNLLKTCEGKQ